MKTSATLRVATCQSRSRNFFCLAAVALAVPVNRSLADLVSDTEYCQPAEFTPSEVLKVVGMVGSFGFSHDSLQAEGCGQSRTDVLASARLASL